MSLHTHQTDPCSGVPEWHEQAIPQEKAASRYAFLRERCTPEQWLRLVAVVQANRGQQAIDDAVDAFIAESLLAGAPRPASGQEAGQQVAAVKSALAAVPQRA